MNKFLVSLACVAVLLAGCDSKTQSEANKHSDTEKKLNDFLDDQKAKADKEKVDEAKMKAYMESINRPATTLGQQEKNDNK